MTSQLWGADTPISMPEPSTSDNPTQTVLGGGFAFTTGGIAHNLTEVDREALLTPFFAPREEPRGAQ